jgi:hypothetical protein
VAGLAAAIALTVFAGTVRHAALVKSAAQPMGDGQKLSPGFILACGFTGTWAVATAAVFIAAAVLGSRRARRATQQTGGTPAARQGRRGRRAAARGW